MRESSYFAFIFRTTFNKKRRSGATFVAIAASIAMIICLIAWQKVAFSKNNQFIPSKKQFDYFEDYFEGNGEDISSTLTTNNTTTAQETTTTIEIRKSTSCVVPVLQPDFELKFDFNPISCSKFPRNPVFAMNGHLIVERTIRQGVEGELADIRCFYKAISFKTDFKVDVGNEFELATGIHPCPAEAMFVSCRLADDEPSKVVFETTLRCLYQKQNVMSRISKALSTALISIGDKPSKKLFKEKLNIVMLGFDSVSHVNWLEQLPKTTSFFQNKLGAVIFDGYNIVGDGTTAAILGLTTGYMEEELHESRRGFGGASEVDDFPFIWRQLADEAGYATLWDEEQVSFGTFHYRLLGFKNPPVDHYGRPFRLFSEKQPGSDADCYGSTKHFDEQVNLIDRLFEIYPDPLSKFALIFSSIYTHNSGASNSPLPRLDGDLLAAMRHHLSSKFYNNTLFILFSDHGSRTSESRATQRGKIAERLPFLGMAFPGWFREKYPDEMANLVEASKKLTTPFDLHATLLDIAGLEPQPGTPKRGISFFKPHPTDRTCQDAAISPHWCTCLTAQDGTISLNGTLVTKCLSVFEQVVNDELLSDFKQQCERLSVVEAFAASRFTLSSEVATFVQTIDGHGRKPSFNRANQNVVAEEFIQISFTTSPGSGQWEATFTHDLKSGNVTLGAKQISRTNLYGDAPKCIQDEHPFLRPFCYCKR